MIKDAKELEFCLKRWGAYGKGFGEPPPPEWDEADAAAPAGVNTIAQARELAPAPTAEDKRTAIHRAGRGRRLRAGQSAGLQTNKGTVRPVPTWACDPIRCKDSDRGSAPWTPEPVAAAVEQAWLVLYAWDKWKAVCLRMEYCTRGRQADKAIRAGVHLGRNITKRRYRSELESARHWMAGHLCVEV